MDGTGPLMLGLVGDSASGKTTLVRGVVRILGHNGVTPVCLDDYYRYSRAERAARGLTDADPAANNLELAAEHLASLRAGSRVNKPVYDHRTGTLRGPETVAPTGLVVAYGMLTLTPRSQADLFDLTVYLEPDDGLHQAWRLARDVRERGYTPEEVLARRAARDLDAERFIVVQRPYADMIVRFHGDPDDLGGIACELTLRRGERGDLLAPTLDALAAVGLPGLTLSRDIRDEDARTADRLLIDPAITAETAAAVAAVITDGLAGIQPIALDVLGQVREGSQIRHSPTLALTQLLIVRRLVSAR